MIQKIHRRKNNEISKEFTCPNHCGKAYGSYAALYTHIKNKHPTIKPPEMKEGSFKPREHGLRLIKQENPIDQPVDGYEYDCKMCRQIHCICYEEINNEELDRAIEVFQEQAFIKFIDTVGQLNDGDKFSWTRGTEEPFEYYSKQQLRELASHFNQKFHCPIPMILSGKWLEYLSLSSRFWDNRYIKQLYQSIFVVLSRVHQKEAEAFIEKYEDFQHMKTCIELRNKEWNEFFSFIRIL